MHLAQHFGRFEAGFFGDVIEDVGDLGADLRRPIGVDEAAAQDVPRTDLSEGKEIVFGKGLYLAGGFSLAGVEWAVVCGLRFSGALFFGILT